VNISFEDKVALVTGAGSGLGLATAKAFAESGASVALADANEQAVRAAAEELTARGRKAALRRSWVRYCETNPECYPQFEHGTLAWINQSKRYVEGGSLTVLADRAL
jgi:NAD(P)-dependent dehydrogenase (short-subunit alcohol dehydrogenase family)